jgi:hypothetical protein
MKKVLKPSASHLRRIPQPSEQPTAEHFALGIVQALQLWANDRYSQFLTTRRPGPIAEEWFTHFLGAWGVARTVKVVARRKLLRYFSGKFRDAIDEDNTGVAVTAAARYIKKWAGRLNEMNSLVSKVAFFLRPGRFVPRDRYARMGMNRLRGDRRAGGEGHARFRTYEEYLAEFNQYFRKFEKQIAKELKHPWVMVLARRLGCPPRFLSTPAFRRKVFDNTLMALARSR